MKELIWGRNKYNIGDYIEVINGVWKDLTGEIIKMEKYLSRSTRDNNKPKKMRYIIHVKTKTNRLLKLNPSNIKHI